MLELNQIHTYYDDSHILQGVSLKVADNSISVLLGRNGMGKSTTINTIMGLVPLHSGQIIFDGKDIGRMKPFETAQLGIALVPQGRRIFKKLTIKENLLLGHRFRNKGKTSYTLDNVYDMFPILRERSANKGDNISGGEQQMLAIARALMTNPDLLLMDEPFEGLAPEIVRMLIRNISELKNRGVSILLVEQNMENALKLADYIYIMDKGRIAFEGTPESITENEAQVKRLLFL